MYVLEQNIFTVSLAQCQEGKKTCVCMCVCVLLTLLKVLRVYIVSHGNQDELFKNISQRVLEPGQKSSMASFNI